MLMASEGGWEVESTCDIVFQLEMKFQLILDIFFCSFSDCTLENAETDDIDFSVFFLHSVGRFLFLARL